MKYYPKSRSRVVLLFLALLLALQASTVAAVRSVPSTDDDFELDDFDTEPVRAQPPQRSQIEADRDYRQQQMRLEMNTVPQETLSLTETLANLAQMLPFSEYLKLKRRILRLGAFSDYTF